MLSFKGHNFSILMDLCSAIIHRTTVQIIHIFHHLKNVGEFLCFLDRGVNE